MRTNGAPASASEYTAALRSPMRLTVRNTRQAISPRLATRTVGTWWGLRFLSNGVMASHPEDAVVRLGNGGVVGGGDGQRQREAGVARVDDAVVPQAGGRVIGVALAVVLVPDRLLEGLFLLLGGEAALLHRGQHA